MYLRGNTWIHQYLMLYATLKLREGVFQLPFYLYVIKYLSIYICVKKKQSLYICNLSSVGIVYSSYILIYCCFICTYIYKIFWLLKFQNVVQRSRQKAISNRFT